MVNTTQSPSETAVNQTTGWAGQEASASPEIPTNGIYVLGAAKAATTYSALVTIGIVLAVIIAILVCAIVFCILWRRLQDKADQPGKGVGDQANVPAPQAQDQTYVPVQGQSQEAQGGQGTGEQPAGNLGKQDPAQPGVQQVSESNVAAPPQSNTCLLYTSDAADE